MKFNVGDAVICTHSYEKVREGDIGIVCDIRGEPPIGVAWVRNIGGHDCYEHCEMGHGYYVYSGNISYLEEEEGKIDLTLDEDLI